MNTATLKRTSRAADFDLPALLGFSKGQTAGIVDITPALSNKLLERNHDNRPISRREVDRLKRIFTSKKYRYNGEAAKFDVAGDLRDGQHRFIAIAESGVTVPMLVVTGLEKEAFATLDQGRKRTGGDVLFTRGVKRYNATSVACATLYRVLKNRAIYGAVDPIPAYGIADVVDRHPGLVSSMEYCAPLHSKGDAGIIGLGYLAAFHYLIEHVFDDVEKAQSFVEGITVGTGFRSETAPILQFRKRMLRSSRRRESMHAQAKTALLAMVVGYHINNKHVKTLTPPKTDAMYDTLIPGLKERVSKMTPKLALRDLSY